MPTGEEWTALRNTDLYDWVWTEDYLGDGSNHAGRIVTRKDGTGPCSGNSIFLPAAGYYYDDDLLSPGKVGYYFSSSIEGRIPGYANIIYFGKGGVNIAGGLRHCGYSIRPVSD